LTPGYDAGNGTVISRSKMHLGLKRGLQVIPGTHMRPDTRQRHLISTSAPCLTDKSREGEFSTLGTVCHHLT